MARPQFRPSCWALFPPQAGVGRGARNHRRQSCWTWSSRDKFGNCSLKRRMPGMQQPVCSVRTCIACCAQGCWQAVRIQIPFPEIWLRQCKNMRTFLKKVKVFAKRCLVLWWLSVLSAVNKASSKKNWTLLSNPCRAWVLNRFFIILELLWLMLGAEALKPSTCSQPRLQILVCDPNLCQLRGLHPAANYECGDWKDFLLTCCWWTSRLKLSKSVFVNILSILEISGVQPRSSSIYIKESQLKHQQQQLQQLQHRQLQATQLMFAPWLCWEGKDPQDEVAVAATKAKKLLVSVGIHLIQVWTAQGGGGSFQP